jgi:hypothetical protein
LELVVPTRWPGSRSCGSPTATSRRLERGRCRYADDVADQIDERAAAVSGLIAALVWMASGSVAPGEEPAAGSVTLRPVAEMIPSADRRPGDCEVPLQNEVRAFIAKHEA